MTSIPGGDDELMRYINERIEHATRAELDLDCPLCSAPLLENEDGDRYCTADASHYSSHTTLRSFTASLKPLDE
jgi:hypothetical protein